MPHRRHIEVVDMILEVGEHIPALRTGSLDALDNQDLFTIVAALSAEQRLIKERHQLCEEAIVIFAAELKMRGQTHEAIQRRMRAPGEKPNASEITRLLRRWEPFLSELREHSGTDTAPLHSSFLSVVESARRAEEALAADPTTPPEVREKAKHRAEQLGFWSFVSRIKSGAAVVAGLLGIGAAASAVAVANPQVELTHMHSPAPSVAATVEAAVTTRPPAVSVTPIAYRRPAVVRATLRHSPSPSLWPSPSPSPIPSPTPSPTPEPAVVVVDVDPVADTPVGP
ncbi:hypothetical protein [Microbispora sp. NPDC049633]|uniref:hypothetical protein n=1 Tax=Microbispora sp. NPDC049633 TaxID=3154355 RepID=UPI0034291343